MQVVINKPFSGDICWWFALCQPLLKGHYLLFEQFERSILIGWCSKVKVNYTQKLQIYSHTCVMCKSTHIDSQLCLFCQDILEIKCLFHQAANHIAWHKRPLVKKVGHDLSDNGWHRANHQQISQENGSFMMSYTISCVKKGKNYLIRLC